MTEQINLTSANNGMNFGNERLPVLRRHWDYSSFPSIAGENCTSLSAGHGTRAVMPTWVEKSPCYQLPVATLAQQTVVVISPLIALMAKQNGAAPADGNSGRVLNSSPPLAINSWPRAARP